MTVFIRPKIGFCNCTVGVADDDEIDRVGDVVLLSEKYRPLAPGKTVTMVELPGRARHFAVGEQEQPRAFAVGIAVASKCDAVVATVASVRPINERVERAAITMLSGGAVRRWVENVVGL